MQQVQQPFAPNSPPVFETDRVLFADGTHRPLSATVRPIRLAGAYVSMDRIFASIAGTLKRHTTNVSRDYKYEWSDHQIERRVVGTLMMADLGTGRGGAIKNNLRIGDITNDVIMDLFNRATGNGSNPDLSLYQVQWIYNFHSTSWEIGGAKNAFSKLKGLVDYKWDHIEPVSCGLISLVQGLVQLGLLGTPTMRKKSYAVGPLAKSFKALCLALLQFAPYPDEMSEAQLLELVVTFKNIRLVIIRPTLSCSLPFMRQGADYVYDEDNKKDKTIFIMNDLTKKHYTWVRSVKELYSSRYSGSPRKYCFKCLTSYPLTSKCNCDVAEKLVRKPEKTKKCDECQWVYGASKKHICHETICKTCITRKSRGEAGKSARCILNVDMKVFKANFGDQDVDLEVDDDGAMNEKDPPNLYVYDIESACYYLEDEMSIDFETDENGKFILDEDRRVITFDVRKCKQAPNLVCWRNVFTDETGESESIREFLTTMLTVNDGNNRVLAHNASGYDSRLLFEEAMKLTVGVKCDTILNGGRFMRMALNKKTIFGDSMNHLKGSLASLAKGFHLDLEKGHFPHLFNTEENFNYIGPIPEKRYFDLSFSCKSQKDIDDFNEWHSNWEGPWCFKTQLRLYCRNDVKVLSKIVFLYHQNSMILLRKYPHVNISPWFSTTTAGDVHKKFIGNLHHGQNVSEMEPEDLQAYAQTTWCVLMPEEHYFDKLALRGGRTDIRQFYHKGRIHYKDIQSHYPNCQLKYDYPVGTPTILVFDLNYYPCSWHFERPDTICPCSIAKRRTRKNWKLTIIEKDRPDSWNEFIKDFFGILLVDVTPPTNLYHPVLVIFDKEKFKCVAPLTPIVRECFTSVELIRAIEMGYNVTKIYRAHRYNKATSLWRGLLGDMYIDKMKYSQAPPPIEDQERIKTTFMNNFGIDLGDMNGWEKNPVLKLCAKQPITSAWGKHAESVDHPLSEVLKDEMTPENLEFYNQVLNNNHEITDFIHVGDSTVFKYKETRNNVRPNLHRGYLPIAVFVPSYGRLGLWEEMNKLGKRVLMHDTDSIIYYDNNEPGEYDIQEGDCLGDWETEGFESENGGITEFVAIGPKSYGLRCANGKEMFKCKGVSIKQSHKEMINFDVAKKILMEGEKVALPQFTMDYIMGNGITTRRFLKYIRFNRSFIKGDYREDEYRSYPYGYID